MHWILCSITTPTPLGLEFTLDEVRQLFGKSFLDLERPREVMHRSGERPTIRMPGT